MYQRCLTLIPALLFTLLAATSAAHADTASALLAMEDSQNPLVVVSTSQGEIYLELFPAEAPNNVANFLALAEGEKAFSNPDTGEAVEARYYNGMRFHRVVPGMLIQAGSPAFNPLGLQLSLLNDEINADALGLDRIPAINPDGSFAERLNIESKADFHDDILTPLYARRNLVSIDAVLARQHQIFAELRQMSVKAVLENLGYRFNASLPGRPIGRGVVALANSGPNTNGAEFFISLDDAPSLSGRHTVIGKVVEGLAVMDRIGSTAIEPDQFSSLSTLIYSVRRAN